MDIINLPENNFEYTAGDERTDKYYSENQQDNMETPRRNRLDLNTPAEKAIFDAMQEVEKVGADEKLTEAVILLDKARNLVADYVDSNKK